MNCITSLKTKQAKKKLLQRYVNNIYQLIDVGHRNVISAQKCNNCIEMVINFAQKCNK